MKRLLRAAGLRGFRLNDRTLPGRPDFAFRVERVAIFVHGCYWHRHDAHKWVEVKSHPEYWRAKWARNRERDVRKVAKLREVGWRAITVWECELKDDSESCVMRVVVALNRASPRRGDSGVSI